MKISEIAALIEKFAPCELAEEWDNVGLLIGKPDYEVNKILVALDVDIDVIDEAVNKNADLIITHHPVIFKPLKSISNDVYIKAIQNNVSIYSCHTNLDVTVGGVNDTLAEKLGLTSIYADGMMRIGKISKTKLNDFLNVIKRKLKTNGLRVCGNCDDTIEKIAVLGGNGGDFVYKLDKNICDLYITGEASYHQAQYAAENGFALVEAGHYETEIPVVEKLVKLLKENFVIEILASEQKNVYNIR